MIFHANCLRGGHHHFPRQCRVKSGKPWGHGKVHVPVGGETTAMEGEVTSSTGKKGLHQNLRFNVANFIWVFPHIPSQPIRSPSFPINGPHFNSRHPGRLGIQLAL